MRMTIPHTITVLVSCATGLILIAVGTLDLRGNTDSHPDLFGTSAGTLRHVQSRAARHKAVDFLVSRQTRQGSWEDYSIPRIGVGDIWATAMVAFAFTSVSDATGGSQSLALACDNATTWLLLKKKCTGWGYNEASFPDADITAWVIRSGLCNGEHAKHLDLSAYQRSSGGLATYAEKAGNWSMEHPDVTANVLLGLQDNPWDRGVRIDDALDYLVGIQRADGSWPAYWWTSPFYTTNLAVELLASRPAHRGSLMAGINFVLSNQNEDGGWGIAGSNTIDTAMCVRALAILQACGPNLIEAIDLLEGVAWLLEHQGSDGSWPASPILRVPPPHGDRVPTVYADTNRVISSALALDALCTVDRAFADSSHRAE